MLPPQCYSLTIYKDHLYFQTASYFIAVTECNIHCLLSTNNFLFFHYKIVVGDLHLVAVHREISLTDVWP